MAKFKLAFEENFDYTGKPNPDIWTYQVGPKWANNEKQCYVDFDDNCYVKDGALHIIATKTNDLGCPYYSSRLMTKDKKHFQYGRFVVRAKMPQGRGSWPAVWFLGTTKEHRWPAMGEIDLLEYAGNRPNQVTCAIHTETYNHKIDTHKGSTYPMTDLAGEFHDYILEWTPEHLSFQVDYHEILKVEKQPGDTFKEWPFDQPYYMIVNLAVGGWYAGDIQDADLPFHFEVAFIRHFELIEA
ncbi:glycoside hydrolase family 16 protein [Paracholeplasma manati]|uniref:Glycoside hydrolase family 16 protein n=1 Tax=Paracholeplasma manati TaxID=591373 RepID=A0ABT2Y617_9MOLU|nr:glycoside hydrolase family 16 protein [Paracholeplasma manati]MCV2232181.1 glycoside hydrolase family 16 protein [Paracholeplasma manati]MDG0888138.1 glycoside hydrolase family 16 protein [Paracholeplasma manati]